MPEQRRTINDEIQHIVDDSINQIPTIELVNITKVYSDNTHVDCTLDTGDTLEYIPTISTTPTVDNPALLIPLPNNQYYIITK